MFVQRYSKIADVEHKIPVKIFRKLYVPQKNTLICFLDIYITYYLFFSILYFLLPR
jgi:hypothetical protein